MKQARLRRGLVLATQNPMDLDYRAVSNAGLWSLGRLQTDADRERVLDGLGVDDEHCTPAELAETVKKLAPRWFVMRNAHAKSGPILVHPRTTYSLLRGPMTRAEIRSAVEWRQGRWREVMPGREGRR